MAREIRKVPVDWEHPKNAKGRFIPLHTAETYNAHCKEAERALREYADSGLSREAILDRVGGEPDPASYMLFEEASATHFQLFERSTEGTPLSPIFEDAEDLVDYATEHCTGWGREKMNREDWMEVLLGKH